MITGNNEDFLKILEQETRTDEFRKLRENAGNWVHPTGDMLYDYVTGSLGNRHERIIRKHISLCKTCAEEVLKIRLIEQALEQDLLKRSGIQPLLEKVKGMFFQPAISWKYWASGIITACLLIFLWHTRLQTPELADMITESYQAAVMHKITLSDNNLQKNLSLPWEKPDESYGFGSSNKSPANRAFGAGLWQGKQELAVTKTSSPMPEFLGPERPDTAVKKGNWQETPWSVYFSLGRWCFLARAVCLSEKDMPYEFWKNQAHILNLIRKNFSEMPFSTSPCQTACLALRIIG